MLCNYSASLNKDPTAITRSFSQICIRPKDNGITNTSTWTELKNIQKILSGADIFLCSPPTDTTKKMTSLGFIITRKGKVKWTKSLNLDFFFYHNCILGTLFFRADFTKRLVSIFHCNRMWGTNE